MSMQSVIPPWHATLPASKGELLNYLIEKFQALEFSRFQLRLKANRTSDLSSELVLGNYPEEWQDIYDKAGYARIDPVAKHCMNNILPVIWTEELYQSPEQCCLRQMALRYNLKHGVTFALHGPRGQYGTLNINIKTYDSDFAYTVIRQKMGELSALRDLALQTSLTLIVPAAHSAQVALTRREKELLQWSARGKTTWEISNICSCSEANVDFHFKNIRRKFGVATRSAAIVQALSMQLIHL